MSPLAVVLWIVGAVAVELLRGCHSEPSAPGSTHPRRTSPRSTAVPYQSYVEKAFAAWGAIRRTIP